MNKLKITLVGSSQLSFPGDKEGAFNHSGNEMKKLAKKLDFELFIYPKQVITAEDGYEARRVLEEEKSDFVLLQCTSFSSGFLAPIFARTKNARLGLWAIPEGASDGAVPFNSLCSINMYSAIIGHYLDGYKVPLKWFYGNVSDPLFYDRFCITVRVLKAIKAMNNSSIALVGGIAPGFDDLYDDERNLIKLFDGMGINRLHEYDELKKIAEKMDEAKVKERMAEEIKLGKGFRHPKANSMLKINARFSLAYDQFVSENNYDAVAISCWPKFQNDYMYSVCAVVGELNDKGTIAACEGDLTSAVSMLFLKYLSDDVTTLMDLSAFDQKDDTVLMWHCGPASRRFCEKKGFEYGLNYSGAAHEPNEKEVFGTGVVRDMVFDPDEITIARLTGESDTMFLATGRIIDTEKPSFYGSRGWVGELAINREHVSALDFLNTVLVQRFQHHFPIVRGDFSKDVLEAIAWMGLKKVEITPYQDYLENPTRWADK
jgi:L-fucose isomerase-like protein